METPTKNHKNALVASRKELRPDDEIQAPLEEREKKKGKMRKAWLFTKQVKHGVGNQRYVFEVGSECPDELLKRMQDNGAVKEETLGSE